MTTTPMSRLHITLVHGTWPRGIIARKGPLCWFDDGSSFRKLLSKALNEKDIFHDINAFNWSGKNSIWDRHEAASQLADVLAEKRGMHQDARQLVIAHSHGGNLALRALSELASDTPSTEVRKPLLVTMATPFVEVFPAHAGLSIIITRWLISAVVMVGIIFTVAGLGRIGPGWIYPWLVVVSAVAACAMFVYQWGGSFSRGAKREEIVRKLADATRLKSDGAAGLLVLRAIDDEASLTIAFGAILNRIIPRMNYILLATVFALAIIALGTTIVNRSEALGDSLQLPFPDSLVAVNKIFYQETAVYDVPTILIASIIPGLLGLLFLGRFTYGREMVTAPFECQVNSQSAPDGTRISEVVTLVSRKGFRHRIYDHESSASTIANWTHAQLQTGLSRPTKEELAQK
jgi:hypothetical protein